MEAFTTRAINRMRAITMWLLRAIGFVVIVTGAIAACNRLIQPLIGDGSTLVSMLRGWSDSRTILTFPEAVCLGVFGMAIWVGSRRLAALIVVLPPTGCPSCGYSRPGGPGDEKTNAPTCPECGYRYVD